MQGVEYRTRFFAVGLLINDSNAIRLIEGWECVTVMKLLRYWGFTVRLHMRSGESPIRVLDLGSKRHRVTKMDLARYFIGEEALFSERNPLDFEAPP